MDRRLSYIYDSNRIVRMGVKKECQPLWAGFKHGCKHFGADPDGDYCGHEESFAVTSFGLSTRAMSRQKLCTHGDNGKYELWEADDEK